MPAKKSRPISGDRDSVIAMLDQVIADGEVVRAKGHEAGVGIARLASALDKLGRLRAAVASGQVSPKDPIVVDAALYFSTQAAPILDAIDEAEGVDGLPTMGVLANAGSLEDDPHRALWNVGWSLERKVTDARQNLDKLHKQGLYEKILTASIVLREASDELALWNRAFKKRWYKQAAEHLFAAAVAWGKYLEKVRVENLPVFLDGVMTAEEERAETPFGFIFLALVLLSVLGKKKTPGTMAHGFDVFGRH